MNFAVISNNIVINLIVADSLEVAEAVSSPFTCIEYTDHTTAGIGWTYDGNSFIAPIIAPPTEEI